jgi:hypothetical protein
VGWEARKRGAGSYYYRSVRSGDRVKKEYVGGGLLGQLAAKLDETERLRRTEEVAYWQAECQSLAQSAGFLRELEEAAKILTRAEFLVSGYHKHKGEWRRLREST